MIALKGVAKGRITTAGDAGVRRAYAYLPDMTRAAVALAEARHPARLCRCALCRAYLYNGGRARRIRR